MQIWLYEQVETRIEGQIIVRGGKCQQLDFSSFSFLYVSTRIAEYCLYNHYLIHFIGIRRVHELGLG